MNPCVDISYQTFKCDTFCKAQIRVLNLAADNIAGKGTWPARQRRKKAELGQQCEGATKHRSNFKANTKACGRGLVQDFTRASLCQKYEGNAPHTSFCF